MNLYHYKAKLLSSKDGDTIVVDVDLGMGVWKHGVVLRLLGIDCLETHKNARAKAQSINSGLTIEQVIQKGQEAHSRLNAMLTAHDSEIIINTVECDSFGRWLANVWVVPTGLVDLGKSVSQRMIEEGFALPYR